MVAVNLDNILNQNHIITLIILGGIVMIIAIIAITVEEVKQWVKNGDIWN